MRIWLGFHATVGIVIFDPLLQTAVDPAAVRLWCVNSQELKVFDRSTVRPRLRTLATHLVSAGLGPLVTNHRVTAQVAKRYLDNRPAVPAPHRVVPVFNDSADWTYFAPELDDQAEIVREVLDDQDAWARSEEEGWFYES